MIYSIPYNTTETGPKCNYANDIVDEIAQNCNQRKLAAKRADVCIYMCIVFKCIVNTHTPTHVLLPYIVYTTVTMNCIQSYT